MQAGGQGKLPNPMGSKSSRKSPDCCEEEMMRSVYLRFAAMNPPKDLQHRPLPEESDITRTANRRPKVAEQHARVWRWREEGKSPFSLALVMVTPTALPSPVHLRPSLPPSLPSIIPTILADQGTTMASHLSSSLALSIICPSVPGTRGRRTSGYDAAVGCSVCRTHGYDS